MQTAPFQRRSSRTHQTSSSLRVLLSCYVKLRGPFATRWQRHCIMASSLGLGESSSLRLRSSNDKKANKSPLRAGSKSQQHLDLGRMTNNLRSKSGLNPMVPARATGKSQPNVLHNLRAKRAGPGLQESNKGKGQQALPPRPLPHPQSSAKEPLLTKRMLSHALPSSSKPKFTKRGDTFSQPKLLH